MAVAGVLAGETQAGIIQVTTAQQKVSGSGGCSLQEAIWAANFGAPKALTVTRPTTFGETPEIVQIDTECVIEPDGSNTYIVVLPKNGYFAMARVVDDPGNYTGPTGTPLVLAPIVIEGNGSVIERAAGAPSFRGFAVGSLEFLGSRRTGSLTLRDVYMRDFLARGGDGGNGGGGGLGAGGAVYVHGGVLTVQRSTFERNGAAGGNGTRNNRINGGGGGGGGMGGNGGDGGDEETGGGGGGGGGARGDGGDGESDCGFPCLGLGAGGGSGGGTVLPGEDAGTVGNSANGGLRCGGLGGFAALPPAIGRQDGDDAPCPGGGGGGGRDAFFGLAEFTAGSGGKGSYGGGGGGGGTLLEANDGDDGGFGGGGGAGNPSRENFFQNGPGGGDGGFGAGGGGAVGGSALGIETGSPGKGGTFAGNASKRDGGGGAGLGGAIFNHAGRVTVENSTFTANYAVRGVAGGWPNNDPEANSGRDQGAAIFSVGGSLQVLNSTIVANEATSSIQGGAGIVVYAPGEDKFAFPGTEETRFTLRNSIIANNAAGSQVVQECRLINSPDNAVIFEGSGNIITADDNCSEGIVSTEDPGVGALQVNLPGLTPTMGIVPPSQAIDAADPDTSLVTDQRGLARPAGQGFDVGAFEYGTVVAQCRDVRAAAGASCKAPASIDDGSYSPDGGSVSLAQSPAGPYSLGQTLVTLTATGAIGTTASCQATVTVVDETPPVVAATLTRAVVSPNLQHSLVNVGLGATATDGCSTAPTRFTVQVYGDEEDEAPTSSSGTVFSPDATDLATGTLRLRAERSDAGNGRVYLIVTSGADGAGNVGRACSTVVVPFSASAASLAAVTAQADAAREFCVANDGTPPTGYFVLGDGPVRSPKPKR